MRRRVAVLLLLAAALPKLLVVSQSRFHHSLTRLKLSCKHKRDLEVVKDFQPNSVSRYP